MDEMFARGHEIWLEYEYRHIHTGKTVECKLCLGHKMKIDEAGARKILSNIDRVRGSIFDPLNKKYTEPGLLVFYEGCETDVNKKEVMVWKRRI